MTTVEPPQLVDGRWPVETCSHPDCRAEIVWAVTTGAKRMPVDINPSSKGNIVLRDTGGPAPLAVVLAADKAFGRTDLRTTHFVTCPAAPAFRRRGGAS